jgi:hypothetical protein
VRNSGRRNIYIAWRSDCSALFDQVECVAYANNVDGDRNFGTLCALCGGQRPSGRGQQPRSYTHTHTHILAGEREKQFLCACGKSYTHTRILERERAE